MDKGKWFFLFKMKINGETSTGDPVNHEEKVEIRLFASTEEEALQHVDFKINEIKSMNRNELKVYCNIIDSDDEISFTDFQIIYKRDMKDIKIPSLM